MITQCGGFVTKPAPERKHMPSIPRILAFAGSAREGSWNHKVLEVAAQGARSAGAEVTVINLGDYPLPLFDADLEAADGLPENARKLKQLLSDHDGYLVATPEYNSSITPLLKNTIDWCSRSDGGAPGLGWTRGKTAAIVSASPGALGGLRALGVVRSLLQNIGIMVIPKQKAVGGVSKMFDESGTMTDEKTREALESIGAILAGTIQRLKD